MAEIRYLNKAGNSGVATYEKGADGKSIIVTFRNGGKYRYSTEDGNDMYVMSQMHAFGDHGEFLNRFINSNQPKYTKLSSGNPSGYRYHGLLKPEYARQMSKIHARYKFGEQPKSMVEQLKGALKAKEKSSYTDWLKTRNEQLKFRR